MKLRRAMKLGAVVVGALGIVGTFVPPASALGTKTIVLQGTATLGGGLGAPCTNTTPPTPTTPDITPTKGTKTCPPEVGLCNTTTPFPGCVSKNNKIVEVNGDTRGGTFTAAVCVEAGVSVLKTTKPDGPEAGTCNILANFMVTGYCGLSQGQGTGNATVALATGGTQTITFTFTWIDPGGGNLIIYGNWSPATERPPVPPLPNNGKGDLVAYVRAVPNPTPGTGSCLDKTQTNFIIAGVAELYNPKVLP